MSRPDGYLTGLYRLAIIKAIIKDWAGLEIWPRYGMIAHLLYWGYSSVGRASAF